VPDIAVVAAAKNRKRVPFWAASLLASAPAVGVHLRVLRRPARPPGERPPRDRRRGLHGQLRRLPRPTAAAAPPGRQQLSDGQVIETFKDPLAMVHWIRLRRRRSGARDDGTYGDLDRPRRPA
jgi:hypothetical protein